jgi:hypothetical protein
MMRIYGVFTVFCGSLQIVYLITEFAFLRSLQRQSRRVHTVCLVFDRTDGQLPELEPVRWPILSP